MKKCKYFVGGLLAILAVVSSFLALINTQPVSAYLSETVECLDGSSNKVHVFIPYKANPDTITDAIRNEKCQDAGYVSFVPNSAVTNDASCEDQVKWSMEWIACPAEDGITNAVDALLTAIGKSMEWHIPPELLDVWTNILPLANIVFAIVFLIVIYSTATGVGLNNYSIKKIMPRLVIIAIAVNVSFYICSALADLSNILGTNAESLLSSAGSNPDPDISKHIIGNIFGTAISGIIAIVLALSFSGALLLALGTIILAIAARYVTMMLLVIISPVAIVAALLPQTEKLFQKWLRTYVQMLAAYPIFMLAWHAVRWVQIEGALGSIGFIGHLINLVLPIAPLFVIMPALKFGGGLMAKITNGLQQGTQKYFGEAAKVVTGKTSGWAKNIGNRRPETLPDDLVNQEDAQYSAELNQLATAHGFASVAAMRAAAASGSDPVAKDVLKKADELHNTRRNEASAQQAVNIADNAKNAAYNKSRHRLIGSALLGKPTQFVTGEMTRIAAQNVEERYGSDEKRRAAESKEARFNKGKRDTEIAQMQAENAEGRYKNAVEAQKTGVGTLGRYQYQSNLIKQNSDVLGKEIESESVRQQLGRVDLMNRARIANNQIATANATIQATANISDEVEISGNFGSAIAKARADKMQTATEQEVKNAIGRQSNAAAGGSLADITAIVNAEVDRGTQIDNKLKTEATDQRRTRTGEGGTIELEGSKIDLGAAEQNEKNVAERSKISVANGGTGQNVTAQRTLNTHTRHAEAATDLVKADSKEQAERDAVYVEEDRNASNRIEGAEKRIKTSQIQDDETDVYFGTGTGHSVETARTNLKAAESNYKDTVNRQSDRIGGVEGTLFRAARSARTAEDREKESLKHLNEVTAVRERRARTGRGGTRSMAEVGRRATEQKGFEEADIERYKTGDTRHNERMAVIGELTQTYKGTSEGQGKERIARDAENREQYIQDSIDASQHNDAMGKKVENAKNKIKIGRASTAELNEYTDRAAESKGNLEVEALEQQDLRAAGSEGSAESKARMEQRKKTAAGKVSNKGKNALAEDKRDTTSTFHAAAVEASQVQELEKNAETNFNNAHEELALDETPGNVVHDARVAGRDLDSQKTILGENEKRQATDQREDTGRSEEIRQATELSKDSEDREKEANEQRRNAQFNERDGSGKLTQAAKDARARARQRKNTKAAETRAENTESDVTRNTAASRRLQAAEMDKKRADSADKQAEAKRTQAGGELEHEQRELSKQELRTKTAEDTSAADTTEALRKEKALQKESKEAELKKQNSESGLKADNAQMVAEDEGLTDLMRDTYVQTQKEKSITGMTNSDIANKIKKNPKLAREAGGGRVKDFKGNIRRNKQMAKTYGEAGAIKITNADYDERKSVVKANFKEYPNDSTAKKLLAKDGPIDIARTSDPPDRAFLAAAAEFFREKGQPRDADEIMRRVTEESGYLGDRDMQAFITDQSVGREDDFMTDNYGKFTGQSAERGMAPMTWSDYEKIDEDGNVDVAMFTKYEGLRDKDGNKMKNPIKDNKDGTYSVDSKFIPTGNLDSARATKLDKDFEERWSENNPESYRIKFVEAGHIVKRLNGSVSKIAAGKSKEINFSAASNPKPADRMKARLAAITNWSADDTNATSLKNIDELISGKFKDANGKDIPGPNPELNATDVDQRTALEHMLSELEEVKDNDALRGKMTKESIDLRISKIRSLL